VRIVHIQRVSWRNGEGSGLCVDEEVHELRRIEAVSIPVDFHIVGITNRLSGGTAEFDRFNEDGIVSAMGRIQTDW